MDCEQLVAYLDDLLDADPIQDYCPNGLQVAGRPDVNRIATAVSASADLFREAASWGADAVLVHHGILWRSEEPPRLVGSFRERVRLLLEYELNLIAYHLPLDRHPDHGNAAVMARALGLDNLEPFGHFSGLAIGFAGVLPAPLPPDVFYDRVHDAVGQEPIVFPAPTAEIASVGIVTGGGPAAFDEAVEAGLDAFVTGEPREWAMHRASEEHVHFIAAGHYATERFGVRSLGEFLQRRFDLEVRFFDYPNPA